MKDYYFIIYTDKATFETRLNTKSYYIIQKHNTAMKSQYLKFIFKNERFYICIWGAITLGLKRPVYFLQKDGRMNSEIYINKILKKLGLLFFKCYIEKRENMI